MTDAELEVSFQSEEPEDRRLATSRLPQMATRPRPDLVRLALGDSDWRVRKEATQIAINLVESWRLMPIFVEAVGQSDNVGLRNAALEVLEHLGPRAAPALLAALNEVPSSARKFVVVALGFAGPVGLDALVQLTEDADQNTAQAALEALARVGGSRVRTILVTRLGSSDPVQQLAALEGLERLEAQVPVSALRHLIGDRVSRRAAYRLLGYSDEPEATQVLLSALGESGPFAISAVIVGLGRQLSRGGSTADAIGEWCRSMPRPLREALVALATSDVERQRTTAVWLLVLAREPGVLLAVCELAASMRLPRAALEAVRKWGVDALKPLLARSPTLAPRARAAALELGADLLAGSETQPPERRTMREALLRGLEDPEPIVAATAAAALRPFVEASDVGLLVNAASRHPEEVAYPCADTLSALLPAHAPTIDEALGEVVLDGNLGAAFVGLAARAGGSSHEDRVQSTLSADDPRARRAAVLALPFIGAERAAELAGFALADESVDVQVAAVSVLTRLRDESGRPLGVVRLRLALKASSDPVVSAAARALGSLGDRVSVPVLRDLVAEGRGGVAVAALEGLRGLGDPGLSDLVVEALGRDDEELVKEALRAIAEIDDSRRESRIALALEHQAWDVRQLSAELLERVGTSASASLLAMRLERESDPTVRAAIETALAVAGARSPHGGEST